MSIPDATSPSRYRPGTAMRWPALVLITALHGAILASLLSAGMVSLTRPPERRLEVKLFAVLPPPPDPIVAPLAKLSVITAPAPARPAPAVVAPSPVIVAPVPPAPVIRSDETPAPPPPPELPHPARAEPIANLDASLLSATPPRYPLDARRKREEGTVVLMVEVDEEGRARSVTVARSSGHGSLDRAAARAVRQWRWSPTRVDGVSMSVRGLVRIPFILNRDGKGQPDL